MRKLNREGDTVLEWKRDTKEQDAAREEFDTRLSSEGRDNLRWYLKSNLGVERAGFMVLLRLLDDDNLVSLLNEREIRIRRWHRPFSLYTINSHGDVKRNGHSYCVHVGYEWGNVPSTDKIAAKYMALKFGSLAMFHAKANRY